MSEQTVNRETEETIIARDTLGRTWQRSISAYRQYRFNHCFISDFNRRNRYMKALIHAKGLFQIKQPFYCRYGSHIYVGRDFTCGHDAVFEDEGHIVIGNHVQMGNHVRLITVKALLDPVLRKQHMESVGDIEIGDHVYIGHDVTILPGVRIGSCSIIADGSIVGEDVAEGSVMVGSPAGCDSEKSALLATMLDQRMPAETKPSKWNRLTDHIDMDKMDQALRVCGFALGVYMSVEIVKELAERKAKWESKKALAEKYLPLAEKLPSKKQMLCAGKKLSGKRKGR